MTNRVDPQGGKNIDDVLRNCQDFKEEKSSLQHLVTSRGHILIMSPKCHPELAGSGVEYFWGKSKMAFRRKINDEIPKNLKGNVLKALDSGQILTLEFCRKSARRTREYARVYAALDGKSEVEIKRYREEHGGADGYELIERMRKRQKTHRNIVDLEVKFLGSC